MAPKVSIDWHIYEYLSEVVEKFSKIWDKKILIIKKTKLISEMCVQINEEFPE